MLKIKRVREGKFSVLAISGRIEDENLNQLEALCEAEPKNVIFDLEEVSLVGRGAINFLARCEAGGATLRNCPAYVREWIANQRAGQ